MACGGSGDWCLPVVRVPSPEVRGKGGSRIDSPSSGDFIESLIRRDASGDLSSRPSPASRGFGEWRRISVSTEEGRSELASSRGIRSSGMRPCDSEFGIFYPKGETLLENLVKFKDTEKILRRCSRIYIYDGGRAGTWAAKRP